MITHIVQFAGIKNFKQFKLLTKQHFDGMLAKQIVENYSAHRSFIHEFDGKLGLGLPGKNKVVLVIQLQDDTQHDLYIRSKEHLAYVDALIKHKFIDPETLHQTVRVVDYYR